MVIKTVNQAIRTIGNMWRSTPERWGASYFYPLQNGTYNDLDYLEAFNCVPELNAIINLLARCHSNGIYKIVDKNGKEIEGHKHAALIKNPNWFQDQKEFTRQSVIFHELYGNEYMYMLFPFGFNPDRTKALFSLPPNLISPELTESQPYFTFSAQPNIKYVLDLNGKKVDLPAETIIHLNDNQVNITRMDQKDILKGTSKLRALTPVINNIRMAYESRGIIIKYRGAQGILSPESKDGIGGTIPMDEDEKNAIQAAYRQYGTLHNQHQLIITNSSTRFQAMTLNEPKKLGLFDECEEDFNKMLDSYNVPSELFVRTKGSTYENQNQARKAIYENNIIPSSNERVAAINQRLFADDSAKIVVDFSHLPIFQEDLKVKSEARNAAVNYLSRLLQDKQITPEEYREELNKIGIGSGKLIPVVGDANQQEIETRQAQATLRGSVGGVQGVLSIQSAVALGTTSRESAMSMLTIIFGFTDEQAGQILGDVQQDNQPSNNNNDEQESEEQAS